MSSSRLAFVLLATLLASAPPARAAGDDREVVLFRPAAGGFALDDVRLRDAVRIYTGDVTWGEPGDKARLTLWYEGRTDRRGDVAVTLYVLKSGDEVRPSVVEVRGRRDDNLYRALALKVRSALVGDPTIPHVSAPPAGLVRSPSTPAPAAAQQASAAAQQSTAAGSTSTVAPQPPSTAAKTPIDTPPAPDTSVAASPPVAASPQTATPTPTHHRLQPVLELVGQSVLSDGDALATWGGRLTLALAVHRLVEVTLGVAGASPVTVERSGAQARTYRIPVYAGARLVLQRGRFEGALGLHGGVAIFRTDAVDPEGERVSDVRAVGLAGPEAIARVRLHPAVALVARVDADILFTRARFTLDGPVLDAGRILAGLGLGIEVRIP